MCHCQSALFKIVLGFTPRRRPWKAGPSQNDDFLPRFGIHPLYTALQGTSIPKRFGTTFLGAARGGRRGAVGVGVGVGEAVVGEAGGRLCPRETHGRPWPCEWVARRHCVKRRGERQYVAKTRNERSGKRRDGAKRKVSEGSCLRWRWWQRPS